MILFEICYIYKLKVAFGDVFEPQTAVNYIPVIDPLNDSQIGQRFVSITMTTKLQFEVKIKHGGKSDLMCDVLVV
jgi:hypothetical protein